MRRAATWLVVGGVLLVAAIAVVAAFLDDGDRATGRAATDDASTSTRSTPEELPNQLEAAKVRGLLYATAERNGACELKAIRLPRLVVERVFDVSSCSVAIGLEGRLAVGSDCRGPSELATPDGTVVEFFEGCAPAYKPGGELSFVRNGNVLTVPASCTGPVDECARVTVPRAAVREAFATLGNDPPARVSILELAWLDDSRLGAVVRRTVGSGDDRRTLDFVVVFEDGAFVAPLGHGSGEFTDLAAYRPGRGFVAGGDVIQGVFVLDDSGQFVTTLTLPQGVPQISSIALSPDGRWAAVASRRSVIVFQPSRQPGRVFQLPFEAVDLEWRGP